MWRQSHCIPIPALALNLAKGPDLFCSGGLICKVEITRLAPGIKWVSAVNPELGSLSAPAVPSLPVHRCLSLWVTQGQLADSGSGESFKLGQLWAADRARRKSLVC